MYSIRQLTLAFGMLFAASAIAAPGARISFDLSASTVGAPNAAPQPTVYEMKRGRSDVQAAKRSPAKKGRILLADEKGQLLADEKDRRTGYYLSKKFNKYGEFGVTTTNRSEALTVLYDEKETQVQNLLVSGGNFSWPYIAGVQGRNSKGASLASGSTDYAILTAGESTPVDSKPSKISNMYTDRATPGKQVAGESRIFYLAPPDANGQSYHEIDPRWINPSGSEGDTLFFLYKEGLGLSGDYKAFSAKNPGAKPVRLLIEPVM